MREIKSKLGVPPPGFLKYLDCVEEWTQKDNNLDQDLDSDIKCSFYFKLLKEETQKDDSLKLYVDWIRDRLTKNVSYQLPVDWLKKVATTQMSDEVSLLNIWKTLSSKEVDYLILGLHSGFYGATPFIVSNPNPLRLPAMSQHRTHPALVSLSFHDKDERNPERIPNLALPVGRMMEVKEDNFKNSVLTHIATRMRQGGDLHGQNSWGSKSIQTPLTYIRKLLRDEPEIIKYLEPSNAETKRMTDYYEHFLTWVDNNRPHHMRKTVRCLHNEASLALERYTRRLFGVLTGNTQIPGVSCETLERKRRELLDDMLPNLNCFRKRKYIVVIDAITPGHPVWLVESPLQQNNRQNNKAAPSTRCAVQIFPGIQDWLDSYWEPKDQWHTSRVDAANTQYPLVASRVSLDKARDMFKAEEYWSQGEEKSDEE